MLIDTRKKLEEKIGKLGWVYLGLSLEEFARMDAPHSSKSDTINTAKFDKLRKEVRAFLKI